MPSPKAPCIEVTPRQQTALVKLARRQTGVHRLVERAQMVLHFHEGAANLKVAQAMQLNRGTVRYWRERWLQATPSLLEAENALETALAAGEMTSAQAEKALQELVEQALTDEPRSGTPPTFDAEQVVQIVAIAYENVADSGLPVSHWTPREVAAEAVRRGIVPRISTRSVGRFLKAGGSQTPSR